MTSHNFQLLMYAETKKTFLWSTNQRYEKKAGRGKNSKFELFFEVYKYFTQFFNTEKEQHCRR